MNISFPILISGVSRELFYNHSGFDRDLPRVITQQAFDGCQISGGGHVQPSKKSTSFSQYDITECEILMWKQLWRVRFLD